MGNNTEVERNEDVWQGQEELICRRKTVNYGVVEEGGGLVHNQTWSLC